MIQSSFFSIGLMSGSSLDGLDICYSRIDVLKDTYTYEILRAETVSFPIELLNKLKVCRSLSELELISFDLELGQWYGDTINTFIKHYSLVQIDFIVSHGHTVFHFPEKGVTKQIGNGEKIAQTTGIKTINNLRQKDIDKGGKGAPIVPIGDLLFFSDYKYCLNLGGIMNISKKLNNSIVSYDIGACNQVLNHYAAILGFDFDNNGSFAREGVFSETLFVELNSVNYFNKPYPKSLDNGFSHSLISICDSFHIDIKSKLNTFCHHICYQIAIHTKPHESILTTGGGAYNQYMVELMNSNYHRKLIIPSSDLINYKESLIMSLIGVRFFENKYNVLASVTGASENTICGEIHFPKI